MRRRTAEMPDTCSGIASSTKRLLAPSLRLRKPQTGRCALSCVLRRRGVARQNHGSLKVLYPAFLTQKSDRDLFLTAIDNPPKLKRKLNSAIANYLKKYNSTTTKNLLEEYAEARR